MSNFTEADLPVSINHEEMVTLSDGTTIRFETNGEAKDLYVGDAFTPTNTTVSGQRLLDHG